MILDKLMEKKDLRAYIKARRAEVGRLIQERIKKMPPKNRENWRLRMLGRIDELNYLNDVMAHDSLKKICLEDWAKNWKSIKEFELGRKLDDKGEK